MRLSLLIFSCAFPLATLGQEQVFTRLANNAIPEQYFVSPETGTCSLKLSLQAPQYPVYAALYTYIAEDTLVDYLTIADSNSFWVKKMHLAPQQEVLFELYPHLAESNELAGIFGRWSLHFNSSQSPPKKDEDFYEFPGEVWNFNQQVVFEIQKNKEGYQYLDVHLGLSPNYPYDSLYLQLVCTLPNQKRITVEGAYPVHGDRRSEKGLIIHLDTKKIPSVSKGRYQLVLQHQLMDQYLNGIDFIGWSWMEK